MKMTEIGVNMAGDPVYNVYNDDGTLFKTTIYTKDEAQALVVGNVNDVDIIEGTSVPAYQGMKKLELEALMREHGIELDRRKSRADLLAEVDAFFKGQVMENNVIIDTSGGSDVEAGIEFIYDLREHIVDVGIATVYGLVVFAVVLWLKKKFST